MKKRLTLCLASLMSMTLHQEKTDLANSLASMRMPSGTSSDITGGRQSRVALWRAPAHRVGTLRP
jgi:hypothetical protein